jgi:hypothetical protein
MMERREIDAYAREYPDVCARIKAALERWERFDQAQRERTKPIGTKPIGSPTRDNNAQKKPRRSGSVLTHG